MEVEVDKFTGFLGERKTRAKNQLGVNMVGLIVWSVLAVIVMGGVVALFASTSQQTAIGAEQNQQQSSILTALNRVSRDVTMSNPIVYASDKEIVLDVTTESGSVERRRYLVDDAAKEMREYSKVITRGASYNPADTGYWSTNVQRTAVTVKSIDTSVFATTPFLTYFDSKSTKLVGVRTTSAETEGIARVDVALTADVANKGNVSLSTSAVPRSTTNLGATADAVLATCPAFTVTLEGTNAVLRWDKASSDATSFEVTRNGVMIHREDIVDPTKLKYSYTDTPGSSGTVLNYMLKVISPAGISNCIDSVQSIVITPGATQLTTELLPVTTMDASNNPVSTGWTNATETTQVNLRWQKVGIASGYILYKQPLNNAGDTTGPRVVVATLEEYPYVDLNASTQAPNTLSYPVTTGWDEHWEWSIKVLSRSGDNDETPEVRSLSYPKPVIDVSISAVPLSGTGDVVSAADIAAGRGNTRITWNYSAGMEARGFDIYRSVIDQPATNYPASFTRIGSADAGVNQFYDRNAEFGSTYGYFVVAKNRSGFANSYASTRVQQLQFPPDPVLAPVSLNGSRDLADRTNRVMWSAAKSASGYHVQRANINATSILCLSGANCAVNSGGMPATATSYTDTRSDVTPASRYTYAAFAYNATGVSPKLAAQVALTQRPAAPVLNKTASPTLDTTSTTTTWNATAGSWCVSGAYSGAGNNCSYEQRQFNNNGSLKYTGNAYATSFNWGNQEWGKNYSYDVRARNAAISNGGWSDYSGTVRAETYPANFGTNIWNGDSSGRQAQRVNYDSRTDVGGWGNVRQAGYTTLAIGEAYGAGRIDIYRVHDGWQATSGDSSLLLPPWDVPWGLWNDHDGTKISARTWTLIAAPGTTYRYDMTATSIENNLQRTVSTGNTITPADVPKAGAVQSVCAGPGNGDTTGWNDHPGQVVAARTGYTDFPARYGYYEHTAVEKLYNPWRDGRIWGNGWVGINPWVSGDNIYSTDGRGYFRGITDGFQFVNRANGRSESATLGHFLNTTIYTYDNCPPMGSRMEEPSDACYGVTWAGCMALNPDERPRWLSR